MKLSGTDEDDTQLCTSPPPLPRWCRRACEGYVDEGQQDGDGLEQGEVLGLGEV